jgi:hypothetical protein
VTSNSLLAFAAALFASLLGFAALVRKEHSIASWAFFAGMQALAFESILDGISLNAPPDKLVEWQTLASLARCFLPGWWLLFGLTYSRGNYREFLARWRVPLALAFLLPVVGIVAVRTGLIYLVLDEKQGQPFGLRFGGGANAISIFLLVFCRVDPAASGKDFSLSCRNNALENKAYGFGSRDHFWRTHLHRKPEIGLFGIQPLDARR